MLPNIRGLDADYLVDPTRVHRRLFVDPDIFDMEMDAIFNNTWVYVAYEGEVREPGDFVTGYIGRQPVIVVRDQEGSVQVLMNRCMHRAATVCSEERGNTSRFTCPYHGWAYKCDGSLFAVPRRQGYGEDLNFQELSLAKPPRIGIYRGFIFASLNAEVPPLEEHLGNAKKRLDWFADVSIGLYDIEPPQRIAARCNWKLVADNVVDGYHLPYTHASTMELGAITLTEGGGETRDLGGGHASLKIMTAEDSDVDAYIANAGSAYVSALEQEIGAARMKLAFKDNLEGPYVRIFPNLLLLRDQIRVIYPQAVDRTVFSLRFMYPRGISPEEHSRRKSDRNKKWVGHGGLNTPDDGEVFARVQDGLKVEAAEWYLIHRGLDRQRVDPSGEVVGDREDEQGQRSLYKHWKRLMKKTLENDAVNDPRVS
jgi:phenylpropionate dioxygenase-like ring-hydroxylating dioxygenase large terminal subunit